MHAYRDDVMCLLDLGFACACDVMCLHPNWGLRAQGSYTHSMYVYAWLRANFATHRRKRNSSATCFYRRKEEI